jgi:hypothetical protein
MIGRDAIKNGIGGKNVDPLKHKDTIRKMLLEEKWREHSKKMNKNLKRRFLRGPDEKDHRRNEGHEAVEG